MHNLDRFTQAVLWPMGPHVKHPLVGLPVTYSSIFNSKTVAMSLAAFMLSACQQGSLDLGDLAGQKPTVTPQLPKRPITPNPQGEVVGNGPVRVTLLVPASMGGGAGAVGKQLRNAAKLAVRDFGSGRLQLVIKDTKGQAAQTASAVAQARDEGSSLVLGPLLSANVSSASSVANPSNIPLIAFSSDTARAGSGTYLLSFAPEADITRTLNYGISRGGTRVVALLPNNAYGAIVERTLRRTYDASGTGQVVSIIKYAGNSRAIEAAAKSAAVPLATANALYIPEGGQVPSLVLKSIISAGGNLTGKQVMGSGQWDGISLANSSLNGAIFAGADKRNFENFSSRYRSTYGSAPTVTAALGYDAVSLAAQLISRNQNNPFTAQAIQSRAGFNGATGIFRFKSNGQLERGQVVNQVQSGKKVIASPAPNNFR